MGVGASILIGVGIYELIQHRHKIKERSTPRTRRRDTTTNKSGQDSEVEPRVPTEKMQSIPHVKPDKQIVPDAKRAKKRKSLIPRFCSKPGRDVVPDMGDPGQIEEGASGSKLRDNDVDGDLAFAPPPPYTSLLTKEAFPEG